MPDLKQLLKEAAAQGATEQQLDVIYNAYQDNLKKKAQPIASATGGVGSAFGSPTFQPTKAYVPAPLIGKGVEEYKEEKGINKKEKAAKQLSDKLNTNLASYYSKQGEEGFVDVENAKKQSDYNQLQAVIQKDLGNTGNRVGFVYNQLLSGIGGAANGLIDFGLNQVNLLKGFAPAPISAALSMAENQFGPAVTEQTIKDYRRDVAPVVKNALKDVIGANVDLGQQRKYNDEFLTGAIGGLAYSAPAMLTPYGVGLYAQAYDSGIDLINSSKAGQELSEKEKTLFGTVLGGVMGKLENVGLNKILGRTIAPEIANAITFKTIKELSESGVKNITADLVEEVADREARSLKNSLLNLGDQSYKAFLDESTTGLLQEVSSIGLEKTVNALKGKEVFDNESMGEMFGRVLKSAAAEGVGGGILGLGKGAVPINTKNYLIGKVSNARTFDDVRNLLLDIERIGEENNYSPEQIENVVNNVNDLVQKKEKLPKELTAEQSSGIISLMIDRDELTENLKELEVELNDTDDALKPSKAREIELVKQQIAANNEKIAGIAQNPNYAVQKPSTTGQVPPVTEGGQVISEGGEGVGQSIQREEAPQAISPEEKVKQLREQEQAEYAAMDNPNDEVKKAEIYDRYDKLITPLLRESKQAVKSEEKGLPKATSKFEAVDVIDYDKPEVNKYKPSEQLKFNQGTYEPVRIVGNEDLIKFIRAGSERSLKLTGKKLPNKISQSWVDAKERELGITAVQAYEKAKEIAKANRDSNIEKIVVLGDKISAPKGKVAVTETIQPKAEEQARVHKETSGSTFTVNGQNKVGTKAASVSIFPERTKIVEGELTKEDIDNYVKDNSDIYSGNEDVLAVGTWLDGKTGETYLDVSVVLPKKEAKRLGKDYNQIAIWDLEKGKEIATGGTGEAIEGLKPEIDRVSDIRNILGPQKALKQAEVKVEEKAPATRKEKAVPAKKAKELAQLVKDGNIDEFLKQINNIGDVEFSTKIVENTQDQSFDAIVDEMNQLGDTKVAFNIDDEISDGGTIDIEGVQEREGLVKKPKYVKISDFAGKPIMLTISDQLSSGNTVNPFTGNPVEDLNGGLFFNYTKGNTESGWAYTDYDTANDVLNIAKELYNNNPELYPDGIVPTAVVKMGEDSITSNEAIARVLSENLKSFPEANKKAAFAAIKVEIKRLIDTSISNAKKAESAGTINKNAKKDAKIYSGILDYLNKFDTFDEAIDYNNIKTLPIATRPYLIKRFTVGQPSVNLPKITQGAIKTDITKALFKGLSTDMVKGIHLAYITNTVSEKSLDNVPARHIISFVGIDAKADAPIKSNHPNYPFALKGKGLGIVKNTKHLSSVFPQAYGNAIAKYLSGKAETPSKAISQAIFGGLKDVLYRNKSLNTQNDNVSKLIGFMNVAFPSVKFMSDANSWNDIINSENVQKHIVNGETIYGLTTNGDIYINPEFRDLNTPIHEMGHIWIDFIQTTNQNLYNKGLELVDNTPEFEASKEVYGDTVKARKEALAILIGNRGENIADAAQKSKFQKWLLGMWEYLQTKFPSLRDLSVKQIENLTLDQFVGGALRDIVGGKEITKDLSALKMSDQFRGEVNFKTVKKDARAILENMFNSKLINQQQYESALERIGALSSFAKADTQKLREQYGFPEASKKIVQTNPELITKAKQAIKDGVSTYDIIERALSGKPIDDVESTVLKLFIVSKQGELIRANENILKMRSSGVLDFEKATEERNKVMDDLLKAIDAVQTSSSLMGKSLQAQKVKLLDDYSLANMIIQKRKANNNQKLTDKQTSDLIQMSEQIAKAQKAFEDKYKKLEAENAKMKLKLAAPKLIKEIEAEAKQAKKSQIKVDLKAERDSILKELSKVVKESRSKLGSMPVSLEAAALIVKLAKNYISTGSVNLQEVIEKVHQDISEYIDGLTKEDVAAIISDYNGDERPSKEDLQENMFTERSKEQTVKDIEDLRKRANKAKDPEVAANLLEEANALEDSLNKQAEKEGLDKEQRKLDNYKKNIQKRIDELQGKLKKGDYSKTPKNEIKLDEEARKLKKELEDIKFKFAVELEKEALNNRNKVEKITDTIIEAANTPRALMATADFSAPLRQGVVATVAYPGLAAKAANEMMVQWASSEKANEWMDDLMESDGYQLIKNSGLYIANIRSAKLSAKEEDFATNFASKIPGAGKLVDASERAYVAFLNKMRVDIFNQGVELLQNDGYSFATNPKAYKTLASYVNAVTGRGSLGGGALEKAGPALNALLFSPRLIASRIQLLTMFADPRLYKRSNRVVRNMYFKDMSKFIGFGITVLALAALAGADVEDDPRSSDFGKIKVGDTRWDIWGGFQQPIRAITQAITEEKKSTTTGKIVKLDGSGYGGETGGDVILRFLRGKLAPVPAFMVNAYTGKDVIGTPFSIKDGLIQMSYPLVIQSVVESAKKDGVAFGIFATGIPSLLGVGVQTYSANNFLKQGVDDKSINLLLSKKAIAIEPNEIDSKVYDINTGEDRKMTDKEFETYYATWADYVKMKLKNNYDEYKDMSIEDFENEFRSIKSEASKLAKEDISGVPSSIKTVKYREDDELESYKLTQEEVKYRKELNENYIARHGSLYNKEFRNAVRNGYSDEEADIIANKKVMQKANAYSKKIILREHKQGKGYDFE